MRIKIGVSACVIGNKVRFDGGHKRNKFVTDELAEFVEFVPICPEVEMGLPIPRPTIRLLDKGKGEGIRLVDTKNATIDHTERLINYAEKKITSLINSSLCGYILCAKSPTCGMERVKIYRENGYVAAEKIGVGLYAERLIAQMPWLPIEEDGRLHDPYLKENFVFRLFALHDWYQSVSHDLSRRNIIDFHSRYKLSLMANNPTAYQVLGQRVAEIAQYPLDEFALMYRTEFMVAMANIATKANNTNVLMHLQGYFKNSLTAQQKLELTTLINEYRKGNIPLLAPLTLIKHHLNEHPDPYIAQQTFLNPYPANLKLRYGL